MSNDIFESVSQGIDGAYDEENRRIQEIADKLRRLCSLYEAESGNGQTNGSRLEIEQRITEQFAKSNGMWIPLDSIFDLGVPGPSGNENDTYVADNIIFKVNNLFNTGSIFGLLSKILLHNKIFPNTAYKLYGFTGYDGRSVMPVLQQNRVSNAQPATQVMIDTYMSALGFSKLNSEGKYSNGQYVVWDIVPRNVLTDHDGDMYVVDAEITFKEVTQ